MFTRRHYKAVAKIINTNTRKRISGRDLEFYLLKNELVEALSGMFKEDNPAYNEVKFVNACYGR